MQWRRKLLKFWMCAGWGDKVLALIYELSLFVIVVLILPLLVSLSPNPLRCCLGFYVHFPHQSFPGNVFMHAAPLLFASRFLSTSHLLSPRVSLLLQVFAGLLWQSWGIIELLLVFYSLLSLSPRCLRWPTRTCPVSTCAW